MSSKDDEIDIAGRFLVELGTPVHELLTLKEFARRDPDPKFTVELLDNNCPDLVAITAMGAIGLELTAYTDDNSHNSLSAVLSRMRDAGAGLADGYQELHGFEIHISPNTDRTLRERHLRPLAGQVLEFIRPEHRSYPFGAEEDRHFRAHCSRSNQKRFASWPLLEQYVQSIRVHFRVTRADLPVMLSGEFVRHFGTRLERLEATLLKKSERKTKAYTKGLDGFWLLIHATGHPRSSRPAPMWSAESERLIHSSVRQTAIVTGFDRVYLWNGVRGGFVEFVSGQSCVVQQN